MRARVKNGRLTLDEPTDLPEGTEVEVALVDGDDLDDAPVERKQAILRKALDAGIAELDAGLGVRLSPKELMAEIHAELGMKTR